MKFCIFLICFFLVACQSTVQNDSTVKKEYSTEEIYQIFEKNIERYRAKLYQEPESLRIWVEMVRYRFEPHYEVTQEMLGHHVKIKIILNDKGYIEYTEIISSSGNGALNQAADKALKLAQPFVVSGLSAKDKKVAKNIVLTFAPEKEST
ncbi:energy transducer TonB [Arsukibacterium sp.]|uniref:energy transducer TonB n=1 Tax=Arsukibacterium sp. TaxID=1977258 RepID=UPI00299CD636|nr:TonB C-terminal domain-containing protein [Arsukibacterium sp.]MDX1536079.1 TonB C-terminal domain-containing protein [Arsukibacterium sp.]